MATELFSMLVDTTLALSAGIVFVMLLRWPLRRLFGATLAYQAWLLIPIVTATVFLPQLEVQHRPAVVAMLHVSAKMSVSPVQAPIDWIPVGLTIWLLGAALFALWFRRAHAAFVRRLGVLVPEAGLFYSESPAAGPALLGLFRPRIIVPADFSDRYTAQEQAMIVEHESIHARRRDMFANLFQAFLQCVFWFNPLVHLAAVFFRTDQELACDAAVLRKHPGAVRTYAQALLKSHSFSTAVPATVACSWRLNHPIKERLMSLQQTQPGLARRFAGRLIVTSLICATGYGALLARAGETPDSQVVMYQVATKLKTAGGESTQTVVTRAGVPYTISSVSDGATLNSEFVVTKFGPAGDTVKLAATLMDESGKVVSKPAIVTRLGVPASIRVGSVTDEKFTGFDLSITVTEADKAQH